MLNMKKIADINKCVRKKGFSLIEILQTVILVGIIAGLSVSFFKKVNTDDKLMMATTNLVKTAIEEANRQMCADETPYCSTGAGVGFSPLNDNETTTQACRRYYGDNDIYFDEDLGYCVKQKNNPDEAAPSLKLQNIANLQVADADNHIYKYNYVYYTEVDGDGNSTTITKPGDYWLYDINVEGEGETLQCSVSYFTQTGEVESITFKNGDTSYLVSRNMKKELIEKC